MTSLPGKHVIITGGSQGIGLSTAQACLARGARVSIIARNHEALASAQRSNPGLHVASADVSNVAALTAALALLEGLQGPCDILITAAGSAEPGYVGHLDPATFRRQVDVNQLGTVNAVQAVLPGMLQRGKGHLVLVSSVVGLIGVFGYAAYAPTKFAVRGYGLALDAELRDQGIRVGIAYPPDTLTPGFERENLTKPRETHLVAGALKPVAPERVADALVRGIERNRLHISADRQTALLSALLDLPGPAIRALMRRSIRR